MTKPNKPRILFFDIETSPCLAFVWGCGKQYVGADQLAKDRKIICIGYAFNDGPVKKLRMNMSLHDIDKFDDAADKEMLVKFMEIYSSADLAVAHNGRRFDIARIRARLVKYGLPDIAPTLFDDSYGMTKNIDFTSHKLDYLGRYLGVGRKDKIAYSTWIDVMRGSRKALKEMSDYMETDVIRLRDVYNRLKPYSKSKLNLSAYYGNSDICPACGSKLIKKNGIRYTMSGQYQSYQCLRCKKNFQDGKNMLKNTASLKR